MGYTYDVNTSKKDNRSTICLSSCHLLFSVINLFLSTFLIAHIYSLTTDLYSYAFNVGLFQLSTYICMFISYFLFSFWVDKSNRIWVYRVANVLEAVLVIITIFYGKDLAKIVMLAGLLNGISYGAYYASYNVLRQEMVSRNSMVKFTVVLTILGKVINIVCPVLLGILIDVSTFSMVAVYVLVLCIIQLLVSFFIKSKRPENSDFNLKNYFKKLKENPELNKKIKFIYKMFLIYGSISVISSLLNINIMMQFGSNFSLGMITSVFSVVTIIVLLLMKKFTKFGKRSWIYFISSIIPLVSAITFAFIPHIVTLIVYHLCVSVSDVIVATNLDIIRNKNLKEYGFYQEIAEHQCVVESILQIVRIISFGLLILVSMARNYILFQIYFVVVVLIYSLLAIMMMKYEQNNK